MQFEVSQRKESGIPERFSGYLFYERGCKYILPFPSDIDILDFSKATMALKEAKKQIQEAETPPKTLQIIIEE